MKRLARRFGSCSTAVVCALVLGLAIGANPVHASGSTASAPSATYTVKSGDSLSGIASKSGVALSDLLAVNGFVKSSVILPGQVIKLPTNRTTSAPSATYTVKSGDSLTGIASKSGVALSDLLAVNGFVKSSVIHPGQVVKLPAGARVAASGTSTTTSSTASSMSVSSRVGKVVDFAKAQVGKPYRFGSAGPDAYDCSGLVRAAYLQIGVSLPHRSLEQSKYGKPVDWRTKDVRAGDLVFTFSSNSPNQIGHVGIAISATEWVQAPFSGGTVRIAKLPSDDRIVEVRRIVND